MPEEQPRIFINYRHEDCPEDVKKVKQKFVDCFGEENVFTDVDLIPGQDWQKEIRKRIELANVFVIIVGSLWYEHLRDRVFKGVIEENKGEPDYVQVEIETAIAHEDKLIVPICMNDAPIPEKIPPNIRLMLKPQFAKLRTDPDEQFHEGCDRIIEAIENAFKETPPDPTRNKPLIALTEFPAGEPDNTIRTSTIKTLMAVGIDLNYTIEAHHTRLIELLQARQSAVKVHLLMIDPDSDASRLAGERNYANPDDRSELIRTTLRRAIGLRQFDTSGDQYDIRITSHLLAFGAIGINLDDEEHGVIYLWYYNYRMLRDNRPRFVIKANEHTEFFEHFRQQMVQLWDRAIPASEKVSD